MGAPCFARRRVGEDRFPERFQIPETFPTADESGTSTFPSERMAGKMCDEVVWALPQRFLLEGEGG